MNQNLSYKPGDIPTHEVAFAIAHNLLVDYPEARETLLNQFEFSDIITRRLSLVDGRSIARLQSQHAWHVYLCKNENAERKES